MAVGGRQVALDPARDTLVNVNALGDPVPSARFMGGREFSAADRGPIGRLDRRATSPPCWRERPSCCLRPSKGRGRFRIMPRHGSTPKAINAGQRFAAISFYLALMTATCLELIGGDGPTIVEGPFARNRLFIRMLAAATARPVVASEAATGTSIGAALLASDRGNGTRRRPKNRTAGRSGLGGLCALLACGSRRADANVQDKLDRSRNDEVDNIMPIHATDPQ